MDTAKFCGNCGNPFQRSSEPTSSLINCPQGHIYSAVYQHCPYCPQPDNNDASSFITRVEEQVTAVDPSGTVTAPARDFATRIEPPDTLFEAPEPPSKALPQSPDATPTLASTELITSVPTFETVVESASGIETLVDDNAISPVNPQLTDTVVAPAIVAEAPDSPPPPSPAPPSPSQKPATPTPTHPSPVATDLDRRTIVMAEQAAPPTGAPRGKIVGWLISYTRNPDGEDFRVYEGYNRIGANPVCDMLIEDETVSGSHAIIVYRDGRCLIKDDLSRNGTFVNGREITEAHPLQNYDQIRVGNTHLTFVAAQRLA
jgi:hypothetical protein